MASVFLTMQLSVDPSIYSTFCSKLAPLEFEWVTNTTFIASRALARREDTMKAFVPSMPEMSLVMKYTEVVPVASLSLSFQLQFSDS